MASVYDLLARCIDWATGKAKVELTANSIPDAQPVPTKLTGSTVPDSQPLPSKRITKVIISTIINAQSVAAGGNTGFVAMGLDGTESLVVVYINIDKQPWTAIAKGASGGYWLSDQLYPAPDNVTNTYTNLTNPYSTIFVPLNGNVQLKPSNLTEAFLLASSVDTGVPGAGQIQITNNSSSTATITVRILRVWR